MGKEWERGPNTSPPLCGVDKKLLHDLVGSLGAKTLLEFGPGDSTELFLSMGLQVTSCEHEDRWLEVARERFKDRPNLRLLKFENEMPVPKIVGMGDYERFDIGFVDTPQGYVQRRKVFPGFEDCNRLNTCLYALERCKSILLHDIVRGLERATISYLNQMGYKFEILHVPTSSGLAHIWHPQEQTSSIEHSATSEHSPKAKRRTRKPRSRLATS